MDERLIATGASPAFSGSLLAFLGSLDVNWPGHPRVVVYDLGLERETLEILERHKIEVRKVPAFCKHWRKHFTWKIWCWNDAPARYVFWIDAGITVLGNLDEAFTAAEKIGYFVTPSGRMLADEASAQAHEGCGVPRDFSKGRRTLQAGIFAFDKTGLLADVIVDALTVAMVEDYIKAHEPAHRHDQAILSLLLYKKFGEVEIADPAIYSGSVSEFVPGQKLWVHRRGIHSEDAKYFAEHIGASGGGPYLPTRHLAEEATLGRRMRRWWSGVRKGIKRNLGMEKKPKIFDGVRDK